MKAKIFFLTLVFIATLACSKNNESSTNDQNGNRVNELADLLKSVYGADSTETTSGQPTPEKSTVQIMHLERTDSLKLEALVLKIEKSLVSEFDNKVSAWINFCKKQPGTQMASSYAGLACKGTNEYNEVLNFCKSHDKDGLLLLFQLINHSDCLSSRPLRSFLSDLIQSDPGLQASSKEVAEEWTFADAATTPCNAQPILFIAKVLKNRF